MDKKAALLDVIAKTRSLAESLQTFAGTLFPEDTEAKKSSEVAKPGKTVTLEEVRELLASLSRDGYLDSVRDLIHKYGGEKLSEIDPADYAALLKDAEELQNAAG